MRPLQYVRFYLRKTFGELEMLLKLFKPAWFKIPLTINFVLCIYIIGLWIFSGTIQNDSEGINQFIFPLLMYFFAIKHFYEGFAMNYQIVLSVWFGISLLIFGIYAFQENEG